MYEAIIYIFNYISNNASSIIAISALGLAIWQGIVIRNHNKVSVRPLLVLNVYYRSDAPQIYIDLVNAGIGPAIIKKYEVFLDNEAVLLTKNALIETIRKLGFEDNCGGGGSNLHKGDSMISGYKERIFSIETNVEIESDKGRKYAHKEMDRIKILIDYESLYGEKYKCVFNNT